MSSDLQHYYAARAPEYDRVYAKPERQGDLRAIERWLPELFAGKTLLEIACGTGYWSRFLFPVSRRVVAFDASPEVLDLARSRVADPRASFITGDAYRPPTDRGPFDAAFAGFWLSHVPKARLGAFFDGLHRALEPGAKVVFLDNRFVAASSSPVSDEDARGDTYQVRTLDDGSVHRVLKNFPSEEAMRDLVAGIGTDVRYHQWPHFWALEYIVASDRASCCEWTLDGGARSER